MHLQALLQIILVIDYMSTWTLLNVQSAVSEKKTHWEAKGRKKLFTPSRKKKIENKTGVINDPLGQTHSLASSEHCFLLFCFARSEKRGWTDNMCENNDPYRPWLWVGRVDQKRINRRMSRRRSKWIWILNINAQISWLLNKTKYYSFMR